MAVVKNFWLKDNTQKLGGAVIYQSKGQTIMRQLAPSVSNPRTDAQMEQRVKLANLVAFYRVSSKWMRGAFETKPANQSDYNAFVSANAANNRVYLTKTQVEAGNAVVAPYQVTRGSLGEITQALQDEFITTNLYIGDLTFDNTTTIAAFSAALIANNNGILEGDQLSIVQYIQNTSTTGNYTIACRPYEVILSLTNTALLSTHLPVDIMVESGGAQSALQIDGTLFVGGVAVILSRTTSARLLVSTSSVTLTPGNSVYAAMSTDTQKQSAIDSYGDGTVIFLDSNLAAQANAEVSTQPRILSFAINGILYSPGSAFPNQYEARQPIIVNVSAPVTITGDNALVFYNSGGTAQLGFSLLGDTSQTGTTFVFQADERKTIPEGTRGNIEVELESGNVLTAEYRIALTGDEGLS